MVSDTPFYNGLPEEEIGGVVNPATPAPRQPLQTEEGWRAHLELAYRFSSDKTVLAKQVRQGPLFVQKPFYPEGPRVCHTYILHPPGGVVGGDTLELDLTMNHGSHVVVTTPAAGKFYRSAGPRAVQLNRLAVAADAILEWLPQETIVYNGADARSHTVVRLQGNARFIGWEMTCLGLPACGQTFAAGQFSQCIEIRRDDRPLFIESLRIGAEDVVMTARWGLSGRPVVGTMVATVAPIGRAADAVDAVRESVSSPEAGDCFAVTQVEGLIVGRFLGEDVYRGLELFRRAWERLRPLVAGRESCPPRIWAT